MAFPQETIEKLLNKQPFANSLEHSSLAFQGKRKCQHKISFEVLRFAQNDSGYNRKNAPYLSFRTL